MVVLVDIHNARFEDGMLYFQQLGSCSGPHALKSTHKFFKRTSILSRIKDYAISTEKDISILFYTGMFKPIIGSSFALFVYALIKGKLLPIAVVKDTEIFIYISLAFLSGFSERFTKDVVENAEKLGMSTSK